MQVLNLTEASQLRLAEIKNLKPEIIGLHISIQKGGCAGMEYKFELLDQKPENIELVETETINIFIARDSLLYLLGSELDFQQTALKSGFILNNPNQTAACGCGESVTLTPSSLI